MQKHLRLLAAGALAVGGLTTWTWAQDAEVKVNADTDQAQTAGERAADSAERVGDTAQEKTDKVLSGEGLKGTAAAPDAEGIRDVLAQVAEAALTKDGLNDIAERFVDADRNRIGDALDKEDAAFNDQVAKFREEWKAKYGQDFDISNEELVFKPEVVNIVQGEIGDSARLAGERSVDVDVNADANADRANRPDANADINVQSDTGVDASGTGDPQAAADRNRNDPGRNIATVTIPESHGMPALNVPMVHEMPDMWRIDIPDTLDGNAIRSSVSQSLDKCLGMKAEWPADVNDAYLAVSHTILAGFFEGQADAAGQTATPPADAGTTPPTIEPTTPSDAGGTGTLNP